ncbi:hypothetical protein Y032_0058g2894 [Ancylostoma ceylanicum]|uniref:VWFA domain-containing protein n=2 Tax=Ancylostoma ceylanicum TaxID=53326 RepID=A0A016U3Q7_9BILA|nr:hypothetical protein Y032_0058g2894 [Ancylostoma ceylanicum]
MRTLLAAIILLLPCFALACVDLLFVLDPSSELSLPRATKLANELAQRRGLRFSVATRRQGNRYVFVLAKNSADVISHLNGVDGEYARYLSMVTNEISRKKHGRTLVVLLFSEQEVKKPLADAWKKLSTNGKAHVFRVGTAKPTNELFADEGETFEELLACSEVEGDPLDIRRKPAITPTLTSSRRPQIQFSKTTRRPTTTRPSTTPGPKLRPVFRRKDLEAEQLGIPQTVKPSVAFTEPASVTSSSLEVTILRTPSRIDSSSALSLPTPSDLPPVARTVPPLRNPLFHSCIADIIFLMDFSDGTGDKSKRYLDIAAAAVGHLPIASNAVRVSLVRYSGPGRAETLFHLDKHANKDDLIEELFRMEPTGGTTRTGEAIHYALKEFHNKKHGARKYARKFIVVFTDGYSQEDPSPAAEAARTDGVIMLAVAVDDKLKPNEEELVEITDRRDMVLISPNGQQLREKILGNQCPL